MQILLNAICLDRSLMHLIFRALQRQSSLWKSNWCFWKDSTKNVFSSILYGENTMRGNAKMLSEIQVELASIPHPWTRTHKLNLETI